MLGTNGYLEIAPSPSLANQNFTWAAWAKPIGAGPNNDSTGSTVLEQDIDDYNVSVAIYWRSTDNRFVFIFGNTSSEAFASTDTFATGAFYHVAATYDGNVFRLFVNGMAEGTFTETKSMPYSSPNVWTIGSSGPAGIEVGYPRTLNGIVDEVQAFNRALTQSELHSIYNAGSAGEYKTGPSTEPPAGAAPSASVNAASYANPALPNSGIAQGSLFSIFGSKLGPSTSPAPAFPYPPRLAACRSTSIRAPGSRQFPCLSVALG
jgi:concanavalin A-like lectin/glucanase superfamily protein